MPTDPTTPDPLARLAALVAAMSKAPWIIDTDRNDQVELYTEDRAEWIAMLPHQCVRAIELQQQTNARGLVALRNLAAPLLAVVRAARSEHRTPAGYLADACTVCDALRALDTAIAQEVGRD